MKNSRENSQKNNKNNNKKIKPAIILALLFQLLPLAQATAQSVENKASDPATNSASSSASSVNSADTETESKVEISSLKNPDWKSYPTMLKGLSTFDQYRGLAPQAEARFILRPRNASASSSLPGLQMRLASDDNSISIPMNSEGIFSLPRDPQAVQNKADLMINRKKELFRWWPYIRSPQLTAQQRRLGDLRMECQMFWSIYYDDLPFIGRNFVRSLGGPCHTKKVSLSFPADFTQLRSATLMHGTERLELSINKTKSIFTAPLWDSKWSDDSIIELEYEGDGKSQTMNYEGLSVGLNF